MRRCRWIEIAGLLSCVFWAIGGIAQVDTVEVRVFGGQRDDRGLRLVELVNGEVLALCTTNSTTDEEPHAWLHRFDSLVNLVWDATISDSPLLQPVDVVEHGSGFMTVLGMRYASASAAYDWGWYTLDSSGNPISETQWGSEAWDIPARILERNDSLWSLGTTYASGSSDILVTLHTWDEDAWLYQGSWSWDSGEAEEVSDAAFLGASIAVATTSNGQAHCTVFHPSNGDMEWTYATPFDIPTTSKAIDVRDSAVVMLFNADTSDGERLGFVCLNVAGDVSLESIPGSGVDLAGEDIAWYSPNNFATVAATSQLGLGEGDWLFSRWTDTGVWQGGPTFGTPYDEIPSAILNTSDGRIWMMGFSDGYSNGRDDVYLLVTPSPQVGNNDIFINIQTHIANNTVEIQEPAKEQSIEVYPNPVTDFFTIVHARPAESWELVDAVGRRVLQGLGSTGDASGLVPGHYLLQLDESKKTTPVWVVR